MFYSHQLLARKAPMGQIWMAATLHAKINRRKLNKLNLVKICEEILNPAVPMALRLSGILMGGVVIVYERKVKILYDDVQRLLVEINEAWKVKSVADRNVLPKGKFQAKYEAVTLPDHHQEMEVGVGDPSDYKHFSMFEWVVFVILDWKMVVRVQWVIWAAGNRHFVLGFSREATLHVSTDFGSHCYDVGEALQRSPWGQPNDLWALKGALCNLLCTRNILCPVTSFTNKTLLESLWNKENDFYFDNLFFFFNSIKSFLNDHHLFSYFVHAMQRLDEVDIPNINNSPEGDDNFKHHHQADADNITLLDPFDSYQMDADLYNRFQRFDIEGDEGTQLNSSPQEHSPVPMTLVSSPPPQEEPQPATDIQGQNPERHGTQDTFQPQQNEQNRGPTKQKPRREPKCFVMDYEKTIIPGQTYQSWLENPSDIVSTKGKRKNINLRSAMKTAGLMDLPPVALCGLSGHKNRKVHYPPSLMELWLRCTQLRTTDASISVLPAGRTSATQLLEPFLPSSSSETHDQFPMAFPLEDLPNGDDYQPFEVPMENPVVNLNNIKVPWDVSAEKLMPDHINNEFPWKVSTGTRGINLVDFEMPINEANLLVTPGNSGSNAGSIPSSESGHGFQIHIQELQLHSERSSKKRPYSSSHSRSNLESVAEEPSALFEQGFKLPGVYENGPTPDHELLVETGPTPSQHPIVNHPIDKITDTMRKYLKTHFDMPGVPQVESLNHLAFGMERRKAAQLFYQTCVLATHDFLRVEQTMAYGDILISRGSKM
ncbi:sister chromatid cohesion 1 protein 1 [Macadamia integrifolia]|uniref:sister chromatid cohesion 1 protein 1 n=1 Tax=Macadamia integrifolia TaxID=60698 RepID=UPI001C532C26|nr:sister chromatid cohesion 1 protein 1 [Macadamia integrifolia]